MPDNKEEPNPNEEELESSRVEELEGQLAKRDEALAAKEQRIAELEQALTTKDEQLAALTQSAAEMEQKLAGREESLAQAISSYRALKGKLDIEKTVDWERMSAAVAALSPTGFRGQRVAASPEELLKAARHLADHYRKANRPLPDTLAALG